MTERLYLQKWKKEVLSGKKTMTRRKWCAATIKRFKSIAENNGCVAAGGQSRESCWARVRILRVYSQVLGDMPRRDVVREGGHSNESPHDFIQRQPELAMCELHEEVTVVEFELVQ